MNKILVEKSDGVIEPFDRTKLRKSLINSSASIVLANEIVETVESKLSNRMTTNEIYRTAFELLKNTEVKTASRYSLKRSLLDLGPTGFPFEKFVARLFEEKGYKTMVGLMLRGACTSHEIDVIASHEDNLILCEIKFHNSLKTKTDTKVTLYVKARYDDLKERTFNLFNQKLKPSRCVVITNTKFTTNATKYAKCVDLGLISWDYPKKGNLYDMIEETGLHPITSVLSLTKSQKQNLIKENLINCCDLKNNTKILKRMGLNEAKINKVIDEVNKICSK